MMKYKVIAKYDTGHVVDYLYEGDSTYNGKWELVEDRIKRHFSKPNILSYEVIPITE